MSANVVPVPQLVVTMSDGEVVQALPVVVAAGPVLNAAQIARRRGAAPAETRPSSRG